MYYAYFVDDVCVWVSSWTCLSQNWESIEIQQDCFNKLSNWATIALEWEGYVIDTDTAEYNAYLLSIKTDEAKQLSNSTYHIQDQLNAIIDLLDKVVLQLDAWQQTAVSIEYGVLEPIRDHVIGIRDELELNWKDADFSPFM